MFLDSLGAPSLFQELPPARGTTPAGTPRHGTGGTAAARVGSSRGARAQVLPADAPQRRARSVSNKMPPDGPRRRWLPPSFSRPAGTRSRSRSPEELPADAALPERRSRSVTNKAPGPRTGRAAASASASGPAAPAEDMVTAALLSHASAPAASASGDYLQDFAAAVETVRAALVTPEAVREVLGGAHRQGAQQLLANSAAVSVLASALDRMASDEIERQERLFSVSEQRPRQPSQPPRSGLSTPRGSVGVQVAAAAIAPKAAADAGVASRPAPTTPPQGPKARSAPHRLPTPPPPLGTAASATPQWPSAPAQTWWSPGWWEARTSSSTDWDSSRRTSASTPFTAKSPIAISNSRS